MKPTSYRTVSHRALCLCAVAPCLVLLLAQPHAAQAMLQEDCEIRAFGTRNRFSQPVNTLPELQRWAQQQRADIEQILAEANWGGDAADFFAAIASGEEVTERVYPVGQHFIWMAFRDNGRTPMIKFDTCWGGKSTFDGFQLAVDSGDNRYTFAIPKVCANFSLIRTEVSPTRLAAERRAREEEERRAREEEERRLREEEERRRAEEERRAREEQERLERERVAAAAAMEAERSAAAGRWNLRLFGAWASISEDQRRAFDLGGALHPAFPEVGPLQEQRDKFDFDSAFGLGADAEYMLSRRIGIDFGLSVFQSDVHYIVDLDELWLMDDDDTTWFTLTVGPNFHVTSPDSRADVYLGPLVGFAFLDDASFRVLDQNVRTDLDDEFVWGGQLGIDWRTCRQCWTFHTGLRYLSLEGDTGISSDPAGLAPFDLDLDPIILMIGASRRF